jgi:ATP-dependent helicase/nuclease subunit B
VTRDPIFAEPGPRWLTIAAHRPFVEDLAAGLHGELSPLGPEALSDAVVLLPTRRAARGLMEAFVKAGGGRALLLPRILALGDLDEGEPPFEPGELSLDLPPAISVWRRRFELARLVVEHQHRFERVLDASGALELADALAGFLDSVEIEEVGPFDAVDGWVEAEMARHWRISADFLKLAVEFWPKRLAELGLVDVNTRRVVLLDALARRWREDPPANVLVAAGSTGTAPATARLLGVIAAAPKGCVVLPGLDQELADKAWAEVDEQHPQGAMKRLLEQNLVRRDQVRAWSPPEAGGGRGRWRRRIINEALRPAKATADWLEVIRALKREGAGSGVDPFAEGLAGLSVITARTEEEAAAVAALLLRETLETEGLTAALVTPDAVLARRVSARLARWGVVADSSAGAPLAGFPIGELAALVARIAADPLDPVGLLAILKHPLTRLGLEAPALAVRRRSLERHGLRGPRPRGRAEIAARLAAAATGRDGQPAPGERIGELEDAGRLLGVLEAALERASAPYTGDTATPAEAARALVETLQALAEGPDPGDFGPLWSGPAGEAAVELFSALIDESDGLPEVSADQFRDLLEQLLADQTVRAAAGVHPRLRILGAIEARLVRADRLILAGLEEGVWPAPAPIDPFLSRPMRKSAGLPPPERRIGLSAHDFAQAACARDVVLLNTERRGDAPAVASRWLWRLRTLAKGAEIELPSRPEVIDWARALDGPIEPAPASLRTATRPRPTPPVAARPRRLPVTGVERWVRDPYSIYAREILGLRPLERPDEPVEARARGTAIHAAFERFAREIPDELGEGAGRAFSRILIDELGRAGVPAASLTRERALADNVAPWVIAFEQRRRPGARLLIEQSGEHAFLTAGGAFTVSAKADRIELRADAADILDFKTGAAPSKKQVQAGLSPQLTLTAAILHHGGFADIGRTPPRELVYVRVSGGRVPGREEVRAGEGESLDLALHALEGLRRRVESFDIETTPYISWAAPQFIDRYEGDYDHLARLWEWHVIGEGDAEEAAE